MIAKYIGNSFKRGCVQLVRRPMYFLLIVIMPILCCWFLMDLIKSGSVQNVPVGIVDLDNSSMSRRISRNLNGFQQVSIRNRYNNFAEARDAVQRGEVLGFFLIPDYLEEEALGGRQPVVSYYVNYAYYAPASMQFKGFKTISLLVNGSIVQTALRTVGLRDERIEPALVPYQTHLHMPGNPFINYNYYLNSTFVPCFLSLFILLVTAFSLGTELKTGLSRQWLKTSGGSMFVALLGKLVPQTVLFTAVGWFIQWMMFRCYDFPLNCNPWNMLLAMFLLVVANQSFAVLIFCFVPNFRYGTMLCTLLGMVSFSFTGFSLPQEAMYPWVQALGFTTPIKYYFLIMVDQALNGIDLYYSRYYYAALLGFTILPMLLSWHLKKECMNPVYVP
ncbi:MAG: ABC transporter permease [Muribaculaceae bacterium]|nr:ABC transporter permease [Muribaculaceae bacterium]